MRFADSFRQRQCRITYRIETIFYLVNCCLREQERLAHRIQAICRQVQSIGDVQPLIDDFISLVEETDLLIREAQNSIAQLVDAVTLIATALFVWMGLNQIVPLYLAWTLLIDTNGDKLGEESEAVESLPIDNNPGADSAGSV